MASSRRRTDRAAVRANAPAQAANSRESRAADTKRARILDAAFTAFRARGYTDTSTLLIATRAKVSKRELYALVGDKQDILIACITARATRMRASPANLAKIRKRTDLEHLLTTFGLTLLTEATQDAVVGMHRLAIAEATRAPEIARVLQSKGRQVTRGMLKEMLREARSAGLVSGNPAEMSEAFIGLLWGDLMLNLLLRTATVPSAAALKRRAARATQALLLLHHP